MNQLTRFNNHFLDDVFGSNYLIKPLHGRPLPHDFKVDVKESPTSYTILADIPGVKKEDIHVTVDGGLVTISADVQQLDQKKEDEQVVHCERYCGSISRSFQLPADIDQSNTNATCENGLLTLVLPKKAQGSGKRIEVK